MRKRWARGFSFVTTRVSEHSAVLTVKNASPNLGVGCDGAARADAVHQTGGHVKLQLELLCERHQSLVVVLAGEEGGPARVAFGPRRQTLEIRGQGREPRAEARGQRGRCDHRLSCKGQKGLNRRMLKVEKKV
jgi:hypothetical protein